MHDPNVSFVSCYFYSNRSFLELNQSKIQTTLRDLKNNQCECSPISRVYMECIIFKNIYNSNLSFISPTSLHNIPVIMSMH